jgi:hypothetical protein
MIFLYLKFNGRYMVKKRFKDGFEKVRHNFMKLVSIRNKNLKSNNYLNFCIAHKNLFSINLYPEL